MKLEKLIHSAPPPSRVVDKHKPIRCSQAQIAQCMRVCLGDDIDGSAVLTEAAAAAARDALVAAYANARETTPDIAALLESVIADDAWERLWLGVATSLSAMVVAHLNSTLKHAASRTPTTRVLMTGCMKRVLAMQHKYVVDAKTTSAVKHLASQVVVAMPACAYDATSDTLQLTEGADHTRFIKTAGLAMMTAATLQWLGARHVSTEAFERAQTELCASIQASVAKSKGPSRTRRAMHMQLSLVKRVQHAAKVHTKAVDAMAAAAEADGCSTYDMLVACRVPAAIAAAHAESAAAAAADDVGLDVRRQRAAIGVGAPSAPSAPPVVVVTAASPTRARGTKRGAPTVESPLERLTRLARALTPSNIEGVCSGSIDELNGISVMPTLALFGVMKTVNLQLHLGGDGSREVQRKAFYWDTDEEHLPKSLQSMGRWRLDTLLRNLVSYQGKSFKGKRFITNRYTMTSVAKAACTSAELMTDLIASPPSQ